MSLYLPGYLEWSSRLRLQSFQCNRFAIQRKLWFPRKLWPCCGKSARAWYLFYISCSTCLMIMLVEIAIITRVQILLLYSAFFISLLPFKLFSCLIERLFQTVFRIFATLLCLIVWGVYRHNKMQTRRFLWYFLGKTLWNTLTPFRYLKCWVVELG